MHVVMRRLLLVAAAARGMAEQEHPLRHQAKPEQQLQGVLLLQVKAHHVLQPLAHFS